MGSLEVVCGGMFSGKTEELLRRIRREQYARKRVQLFKHGLDQRYTDGHVEAHSAMKLPAISVATPNELLLKIEPGVQVVGIDEVQFFDASIVSVVTQLADQGIRVIVAGLDMDYRAQPFGPMPELLARAEEVAKVRAICVICGAPASRSHRLSGEGPVVEVGAAEVYEARCRTCDTKSSCSITERIDTYETA